MHVAVSESPFSHRRESIRNFQGGSGAIGTECGAQLITLSLHRARRLLRIPILFAPPRPNSLNRGSINCRPAVPSINNARRVKSLRLQLSPPNNIIWHATSSQPTPSFQHQQIIDRTKKMDRTGVCNFSWFLGSNGWFVFSLALLLDRLGQVAVRERRCWWRTAAKGDSLSNERAIKIGKLLLFLIAATAASWGLSGIAHRQVSRWLRCSAGAMPYFIFDWAQNHLAPHANLLLNCQFVYSSMMHKLVTIITMKWYMLMITMQEQHKSGLI